MLYIPLFKLLLSPALCIRSVARSSVIALPWCLLQPPPPLTPAAIAFQSSYSRCSLPSALNTLRPSSCFARLFFARWRSDWVPIQKPSTAPSWLQNKLQPPSLVSQGLDWGRPTSSPHLIFFTALCCQAEPRTLWVPSLCASLPALSSPHTPSLQSSV